MQMTIDAQKKVAVMEVLAEKIMRRLEKLNASEEKELAERFGAVTETVEGEWANRTVTHHIPAKIYETAIERLAILKKIRKVRSSDGIVFITKATVSKEQLVEAARRYRKAQTVSERRIETRKQLERDLGVQFYAKATPTVVFPEFPEDCIYPAQEDAFIGNFDWKAYSEAEVTDRHYSELPTFGLGYEAAAEARYEDATLPSESEAAETASKFNREHVTKKEIGEYQQQLIERQIQTGQGRRNARRARNRYFAKPENARFEAEA